jgi:acetylornithine deacetylase/succinyl-diaminopimelate desuccinylase-like protein
VTAVDEYIEKNRDRFVDELAELCTFPSVATEGADALRSCREWLGDRLGRFSDRVETLEAGGMPSLYAELPGGGTRSLLLYQHYDVQPAGSPELWKSPPYEPAVRDGRLFARGVCDDKSDVMARLQAVETLRAVHGTLPLTLGLLIEGEEEIGSTSFEHIVEANSAKLRADGCLWESASFNNRGAPEVFFGARGVLYVQLKVKRLNFDQHSALASLFPSAPSLLVRALASLADEDQRVAIEGFYEDVVAATDEDRRVMASIDPELDDNRRLVGFDRLVGDPPPDRAIEQLLFTPTCNIDGITTGYQGSGSMTILPAEATAKIDFRLIPNQDPEDILRKLRAHLDSHGFDKVEFDWAELEKPSRSPIDSEIGRTVLETEQELFGQAPAVWPFASGSGPMHPIAEGLGVPIVGPTGAGRPDSRFHAPDENVRLDDYIESIKLTARILERFGAGE